ncbi:MAG: glycoside hydrolase family 57 [Parcubacteria group bacterium]|nr:glycoside hydrolase family 57 [Parcubacteria group bacterium]
MDINQKRSSTGSPQKGKLNIYSVFHLNLSYSSIPEKFRGVVIKRCYWPLLNLANDFPGAITIEASGYTLERIQELDPSWISLFRDLLKRGVVTFVGSGYAQIIGPLVPSRVNEENLKIGNQIYESLLGIKPTIAYVNEQAYSRSLIAHYKKAGYAAIIMEWNNPRLSHPEWPEEFQYYSHHAIDHNNNSLPVIWNNSIAFQKFQQYAHNELDLDEYLAYIRSHRGEAERAFPLYGSDVEIFDFRPGRYKEEALSEDAGEWERIRTLFEHLREEDNTHLVFSENILEIKSPHAFHALSLESSDQPIPVKKQLKYNITRWALTGRDNVKINSKCFKIFNHLNAIENARGGNSVSGDTWKELCYLWGSDFRTHIEEERYKKFLNKLENARKTALSIVHPADNAQIDGAFFESNTEGTWHEERGRLIVKTPDVHAIFNTKRGLAVESLLFPKVYHKPIVGTVPHGYYDDITLGDDFLSGHTSIDIPMRPEMTDLMNLSNAHVKNEPLYIEISGNVSIDAGIIHKTIRVHKRKPKIDYIFSFDLKGVSPSSFRSGIFTFIPESFDRETLYYGCHNGGLDIERFSLSQSKNINLTPVSSLVSSRTALGNTEGIFVIGDKEKHFVLKTDMAQVAGLPMLQFNDMPREETFLLRVLYSLGEFNETSFLAEQRAGRKFSFPISIEASRN